MICYPDEERVKRAFNDDEPMLALISFDGKITVISPVDEAMEHHILLMKAGFRDKDIDSFFRIVLDRSGADWTFVCPPDYKNISIKDRRIEAFYKDGFAVISDFLHSIGYLVGINIPKRYRRHFNVVFGE